MCKDGDRKVALFGLVVELHLVHPADDLGMLCSMLTLTLGYRAARGCLLTQSLDSHVEKNPNIVLFGL